MTEESLQEVIEYFEGRIRESEKRAVRVWRSQLALLLAAARENLELAQAAKLLVHLVREEYPVDCSLVEIAETWGGGVSSEKERAVLQALDS